MSKRKKNRRASCPSNGDASVAAPLPPAPIASSEPPDEADAKQKQREVDDKVYDEYRDSIVKAEQDFAKEYDKWVLTLAGAALGLSVTLVKDFLRPNVTVLTKPWCLYLSWGLFGLPVALIMFNQQVSYSAYKRYRKIVDTAYKQYEQYANSGEFWQDVENQMKCVWRNHFIEVFNWLALFSFLGGLAFLVVFVSFNVK